MKLGYETWNSIMKLPVEMLEVIECFCNRGRFRKRKKSYAELFLGRLVW